MKKAPALLVALFIAIATLGLAACGDDDDDSDSTEAATTTEETQPTSTEAAGGGKAGSGGAISLSAPADGSFAYDTTELNVANGSVTVNFDNPAPLSHDVVIEDASGSEVGKTDLISEDTTSTTVDLTPGTYTFFCDVPGHREGGMEGTLTVE
jgi:plastocyanin